MATTIIVIILAFLIPFGIGWYISFLKEKANISDGLLKSKIDFEERRKEQNDIKNHAQADVSAAGDADRVWRLLQSKRKAKGDSAEDAPT